MRKEKFWGFSAPLVLSQEHSGHSLLALVIKIIFKFSNNLPPLSGLVYWSYGPCICYMVGGLAMILPILILARVHVAPAKTD